jgi:nucleotide-binding universal stress UspA family protein
MIQNVLVSLDGSALAEQALDVAREMAKGLNAHLTLCRVVSPPVPGRFYAPGMLDELREAQIREAEAYLEERKADCEKDGSLVETKVMTGEAARTIVTLAGDSSSDLIVMSSHGLGGRGWAVFGSVAQKVLHSAEQPVLIVKPDRAAWEREEEDEEELDDAAAIAAMEKASEGRQKLP